MILSRGLPRIRRSARAFARAPGLTIALLLTIAVGVGSNAAIYGFLQGLIQSASPLRGVGRVVSIFGPDRFRGVGPLSVDGYRVLKSQRSVFAWTGAARIRPREAVIGGVPRIAIVGAVNPDLARSLQLPLVDGVVISHRLWEYELGGANVVGSRIHIDDSDFRIEGVAPDHLDGLYSDRAVDLWIPLGMQNLQSEGPDRQDLWVVAGLKAGVSTRQAQNALLSGAASIRDATATPFSGIAPDMGRGLSRVGMFLSFSAGVVFFIACINVASLLLGRALRRSHETSLRIALGATRAELVRELVADSVVISVAGGAVGLLLGFLTACALPSFLFEADAERLIFAPHALPIVTAALACVVITIGCGMMPALGTVTDRPWTVLQRETGLPSKAIQRLRSGLVVGQITACCMLILCTALLLDGLQGASETSAGHRLGDPLLLTVQAPARPDGPEIDASYFSAVERKAKSVAGLTPLAWMARLPGNRPMWVNFRVQLSPLKFRDVAMDVAWLTPESLKRLDNRPIAGRLFSSIDAGRRVALVDEEAAAKIFGRQTAGMVIRDINNLPIEIIGVVRMKPAYATQPNRPTIYYGYVEQSAAPRAIRDAQFRVPLEPPAAGVELNANVISASYFGALDMPLVAGQKFSEERIAGEGRVGVINQEAADLYFNGRPLGAGVIDETGARAEIIGVVKSQVFGTFEQRAEPAIYFPMWQDCPPRLTLMLNGAKGKKTVNELRYKIESIPLHGPAPAAISTLDAQLAQSGVAALRIATLIGSMTAGAALILSILGLLSAQGDAERQRQRERALRIALGAQRWRIVLLVMTNASRLALAGTAAGTLLSFVLLRLVAADVSVISSPRAGVWLIAPLLPAAAVMIASVIPARRASVTSPLEIMRDN